jgi:hypothetical protein
MTRIRISREDDRTAWSAVGGVVLVLFGGGAVAWWLAAEDQASGIPRWPAYVFLILALGGLYVLIAPLLGLPGWSRSQAASKPDGDPTGATSGVAMAKLVESASAYVAVISTPHPSGNPGRRAARELRRAAANAKQESPAAAEVGLDLAGTSDPARARELEMKLRRSVSSE